MKLNVLKSTKSTNIILALLATVALAGWKKDYSIGNMVVCFVVASIILIAIDLVDGWTRRQAQRKMAKKQRAL